MRKLLSKKANIFGKQVPVFVIALIAVLGLASAALVPYLSGLITGNVVVESPLELKISTDGINWEEENSINLGSIYGGESTKFYTQEINRRDDVAVPADLVITITDEAGNGETSCDELESVIATSGSWSGDLMEIATCDDTTVPGTITLTLHKDVAVGTNTFEITPTFALNAIGNYEVEVQFMNA